MGEPSRQPVLSVAQYLATEAEAPTRREYAYGQVYAMGGASMGHARIVRNLSRRLDAHLDQSGCEVVTNDLKVRVNENAYYYPDLLVTCESLPDNALFCERPVLLVEVLSPTTTRIDRVEKMNAYQHLDGLREYAIVAQDRMRVEVYRHDQTGALWTCEAYTEPHQEVVLKSIAAKISMTDLYRGVTFTTQEEEPTNL
ncbi:MAG: Uma2 family endonuclease [Blastocatellia bacterium]|nr:Uma2 family endonuclease [Blastocatellia bacterium]